MPKQVHPIYIIGAGGIVTDAHLPAYKIAEFTVAGIFDIDAAKAQAAASLYNIPNVYSNLDDLVHAAPANAIFDIAVPGIAIASILSQLPNNAYILMQKPMGDTLEAAKNILKITRDKKQIAAVNFQLRYAPFVNEARSLISSDTIGDICNFNVAVNVYTPWHLWSFLNNLPRVEMLYHSVHYIDLIRSLLGNPVGMYAKTTRHPKMEALAAVNSQIIMDYGEWVGANITANHCHNFGAKHQDAIIKIEGTKGAIRIRMGLLMDYPTGVPDIFEYTICSKDSPTPWQTKEIVGGWFPHAFIGSMAQVMLAAEGTIARPDNDVEDIIHTMECVEAAFISSASGGIRLT